MDSPLIFIIQMNSNPQPQDQGISIQELQEDLGIFEVRLDEKLKELTQNFSNQHYELDVNKSYYDHFSNFDAQFKQNMNDLTQFLIKDQLASTPTLRSTFYKVLENPLFCLFKSSKFELFELCLNGFDIEYQPDEAIKEVHKALLKNTQDLKSVLSKGFQPNIAQLQLKIFPSPDALLFYSYLKSIQFKIFTLYSYIRKGAQFLKKEYEHRLYIAEMFASIQKQLIPILVSLKLVEPLRELTTLNFQIVSIEPTYDYFFFFFSIPPKKQFLEVYQSISLMAEKCEKNRNYNPFVIFALKHHKELNLFLSKKEIDPEYTPLIISLVNGAIRLLRAEVGLYEEFVSVLESLLNLSKKHYEILENFLTFKPQEEKEQLVAIRQHWKQDVLNKKLPFLFTLRELTFEQVKQRLEKAQQKYLFSLTFPDIDNTRLRGMLELIGGVPQKFFDYVEKDFKAWNPTTAITGKYKYIESQFTKSQEVVNPLQNLKTINNFLHVSGIFPKEYDDLLESKLNARFFFDLLQYLLKSESLHKALGLQLQFFILNALGLYVSTKNHKEFLRIEDKVRYLSVFANASFLIHTANNQLTYISTLSKQIEELKYDLSTKQYIGLLTTIAISLPNTKEQCMRSMLGCFTDLDDWNQKVKANRFHEQNTFTLMESSISKEESKIIKEKYSVLNNKLISHDLGLFKFSTQDISTNPLNFESRIDDIFISLTPNAKKIIQVLLLEIVNEIAQLQTQGIQTSPKLEFLLEIVKSLCHQYPIVVPYVVSLKIPTKLIRDVAQNQEIKTLLSDSITFGEFLCQAELICKANKVIPELIISLLKEKSIKYLNGKDYVKHEIAPTISEALVKIVNHQRSSKTLKDQIPKILSLLVLSLQTQDKLQREQVETVKGLLLVLRQQMSIATDASRMLELSTVYKNCIKLFFKYKGNELNKPLLESTYSKYGNAQIQNYDVSDKLTVPVIAIEKLKNQTLLNFAVNLDFDLQNSKLIRTEAKTHSPALYDIHFKDILQDIKAGTDEVKNHAQDHVQKELNVIDLNGSKYNLLYHLGEQRLNTICSRTECQFKLSANKIYPEKQLTNEQQELRNIVAFYSKQVFVPTLSDSVLQGAVISLLKGGNQLDFLRNPNNFDRVSGLLTLLLVKDYSTVGTWGNSEVIGFIKGLGLDTDKTKHEDFVNRILDIFSQIGYSNFWVYSFGDLSKRQLKATQIILSAGTPTPTTQSLLSLILTFTLESYVSKRFSDYSKFSHFIKSYFSGRPEQNQVLTYKVTVNKNLLNLILKCIDFQHLNYVSILFYSNFQNLRLYTDDLQEGFKALNLASKTRAYNQFIRLSNEYNDIEYLNPLRIFKQNLKFFTKIEKEGYLFKVDQEAAITVERIINQVKSPTTPQIIDAILDQYFLEVNKLKANTINRVKSIYLSSKLRDLSLQNGTTIALLYEVLKRLNTPPATITEQINKVELFSILCSIHYDLLSFQSAYNNLNKYANYSYIDNRSITEDIVFSTTKRFGFNMNQNLNQLELELDEVIQSALTNAKPFFVSDLGQEWIEHITINPALPTYNRVRIEKSRTNLILNIQQLLVSNHQHPAVVTLREELLCEDLVRELSSVPSANFLKKDGLLIQLGGARVTLDSLADKVISQALKKQILLKIDQSYIINKNKFSQDSLDVLKALGFIISYCIFWKIQLNLPLHHSIICQICSCIVNLDDLLSIDFKTWEYLRMVLSEADSKTLNLNFSYEFDSLTDPNKKQKIQLIDKGVQKKVNNLNREEYVDFICCRILFGSVKLQLQRLLTGVFKVLPKQYIANLKFKDVLQIFYKIQNKQLTNKLAFESLKKFGIILPETYTSKDSSFQNLKDYVNINWLMDSLQELSPEKYLRFSQALGCKEPEFLNLSIYTRTGATESLQLLPNNTVIINHFKSKEGLKAALSAKL